MKKKKCASCGKKKPDGKHYSCIPCESKKDKVARRKNRKIYATSRCDFDPQNPQDYITKDCEVCGSVFFPTKSANYQCKVCQESCMKVYGALSVSNAGWHGPRRRYEIDHESMVILTRKYMNSTACQYCGRPYTEGNPKSFDHIIPKSKAGNNHHTNINICCLQCNRARGNLPLEEWFIMCSLVSQQQFSIRMSESA